MAWQFKSNKIFVWFLIFKSLRTVWLKISIDWRRCHQWGFLFCFNHKSHRLNQDNLFSCNLFSNHNFFIILFNQVIEHYFQFQNIIKISKYSWPQRVMLNSESICWFTWILQVYSYLLGIATLLYNLKCHGLDKSLSSLYYKHKIRQKYIKVLQKSQRTIEKS